jgi:hypothetical protein
MSAIFSNIRIATATLSTATPLPIYANSLNGKNHPAGHIIQVGDIQVGDDYLILSELDWNL